jgi:large subunit ribosomal protein L1
MKRRSKRYKELKKLIESGKLYSLDEAIDLVKKTANTKFDSQVEVHLYLGVDIKKQDQIVRGTVNLPYGTGQKKKIAVFAPEKKQKELLDAGAYLVGGDELIEEIKKTGKCDFEIALATPEMMKSLAKIARILGQKGLMPNPKNETITMDPKKTIEELTKGKITFKSDESYCLHQVIGRVSFEKEKLLSNLKTFLEAVKKAKPQEAKGIFIKSITICSSMGPGIRISG